MTQPRDRRIGARRRAQREREARPDSDRIALCALKTGEARNPIGSRAALDRPLLFYGQADLLRGEEVYCCLDDVRLGGPFGRRIRALSDRRHRFPTLRRIERHVRQKPRAVWRLRVSTPLWNATWERRLPGRWVCVEAGRGFED